MVRVMLGRLLGVFPITIKFDSASLQVIGKLIALGDRIMDYLEGKQQAEIDLLTVKASDALARFHSSEQALQGAITNQK